MNLIETTLGGLTCQVAQSGPKGQAPQLAVVLCHGFGAPGTDLVSLAPELEQRFEKLRGNVRYYFPAAPLHPPELGGGRAWWMIDIEHLAAMQNPTPAARAALRKETPEGLPKARRLLMSLLEEVTRQTKLSYNQVVLGGFSQGAMLSTDVALHLDEPLAALALFSGTLLSEDDWKARAPRRRGLPVLQSHGQDDPLLPFASAEALRDLLRGAGLSVEFLPFAGGHTISLEGMERFGELLLRLLPKK